MDLWVTLNDKIKVEKLRSDLILNVLQTAEEGKNEMVWSPGKEDRNRLDDGACQSLLNDVKKGDSGRGGKTWKECVTQ